jgi:hypothetical protein
VRESKSESERLPPKSVITMKFKESGVRTSALASRLASRIFLIYFFGSGSSAGSGRHQNE